MAAAAHFNIFYRLKWFLIVIYRSPYNKITNLEHDAEGNSRAQGTIVEHTAPQ